MAPGTKISCHKMIEKLLQALPQVHTGKGDQERTNIVLDLFLI